MSAQQILSASTSSTRPLVKHADGGGYWLVNQTPDGGRAMVLRVTHTADAAKWLWAFPMFH